LARSRLDRVLAQRYLCEWKDPSHERVKVWMRLKVDYDYATFGLVDLIFILCGFLKVLFVKRQLDLTRILFAASLVFATSNFIDDPWIKHRCSPSELWVEKFALCLT
jgi:hypothetical protein